MPKKAKELTAIAVTHLKDDGRHMVGGCDGLHLRIAGESRSWILRLMIAGKRRDIGVGPYPEVSLAKAREAGLDHRRNVRNGIDPLFEKEQARAASRVEQAKAKTFEECAREYVETHKGEWKNDKHVKQWTATLETYAYTWLLNSMDRYEPFLEVARKSLMAAGAALNVRLSTAEVLELVAIYGQLDAWPDVANALQRLRTANIHAVLLSNLGEAELGANLKRNGLSDLVGTTLSTDRARRFKPAPGAYAMATSALALGPEEIAFAAFAGWDAAGARSFGYQTAWINRLGAGAETLGPAPDVIGTDMEAVLRLAGLTTT